MGKIWLIKVAVSMFAQCCDTSSHWVRWLAEKQQQWALMGVCVIYKCLKLSRGLVSQTSQSSWVWLIVGFAAKMKKLREKLNQNKCHNSCFRLLNAKWKSRETVSGKELKFNTASTLQKVQSYLFLFILASLSPFQEGRIAFLLNLRFQIYHRHWAWSGSHVISYSFRTLSIKCG